VGSSSEVNSPVSPIATEDMQEKLEEFDETRGKLDVETTANKTHDSSKDFTIESSGISRSIHQLCVIITKAAEEDNHESNKEVDLQVDNPRSNNKKEKRKFTFQPESGESSCQPSITAQRYPQIQGEKF
jgi:hypothetical protein